MYGTEIESAYLGALYALQHEDYPDRIIHFAHSLRESIDLLARSSLNDKKSRINGCDDRKKRLQWTIDPIAGPGYGDNALCEQLARGYGELSEIAHHNNTIDDKQADTMLSFIEDALYMLTTPQTQINDEIDQLVLGTPSIKNARTLLDVQLNWASQWYMLAKLPTRWLHSMIHAGFFTNPQPFDRSSQPKHWMPSMYLTKCARVFPDEVATVVLACVFQTPEERNPAVYVDFLSCALHFSTDDLEKMGQKMLNEQWFEFLKIDWFAIQYVRVVELIYLKEQYDLAIELMVHLLCPANLQNNAIGDSPGTGNASRNADVFLNLDQETIHTTMQSILQKNPIPITELLIAALEKRVAAYNESVDRQNMEDGSNVWIPLIAEFDHNWSSDIRSLLVYYLKEGLLRIGRDDALTLKRVIRKLYGQSYWIFRRLELHVYAQFPSMFKQEIAHSLSWYFYDSYPRQEYSNLVRKVFPFLPDQTKHVYYDLIDDDTSLNIPVHPGDTKGRKMWRYSRYEIIKEELDESNRQKYNALCSELEMTDFDYNPHSMIRTQTKTDPQPLSTKNTDQVFREVTTYDSSKVTLWNTDQVLTAFQEYVEHNPMSCSKKSIELQTSNHNVQYTFFSGLLDALRNDKVLDWNNLLTLIDYVTTMRQTDATMSHSSLLSRICSLLEEGLKNDLITFELRERLWQILECMYEIGNFHSDSNDHYLKRDMGSLTISLNDISGLSFHLLCRYAVWYSENKHMLCLNANVKESFSRYLNDKTSHTVSRHGVLGGFFTTLHDLDPCWTDGVLAKTPSKLAPKIAFWDSYITYNRLRKNLFKILRDCYNHFLNSGLLASRERMNPYRRTIHHLLLAYFYDFDGADKIIEKFFNKAKESQTNYCIDAVSLIIKDKKMDTKFNKQKLIKLWKQLHTKHDLGSWFRNSPLSKHESITLYLDHVNEYPGEFNLVSAPVDELDSCIADHPRLVVDCLNILIQKSKDNRVPDQIKNLVATLLKTNDEKIRNACHAIINRVGRRGCDWRDLV